MKIKVGDQIFDGEKELVAIHLTPQEKEHIANMADWATVYCQSPDSMSDNDRTTFINEFHQKVKEDK